MWNPGSRLSWVALAATGLVLAVMTEVRPALASGEDEPASRYADDLRAVPVDVAARLHESLRNRADSCRVEWTEPYFYLWEWAQARCEATRCELTEARTISAVAVVLFNYGSEAAEKPLRVFVQEDSAGQPGATLWSLETTTTLLEAGETKTVVYAVDPPLEISAAGPIWFGHVETTEGPPTSLFDGVPDAVQAAAPPPCGEWFIQNLGDYLQYLPVEVPSAAPSPLAEEVEPGVRWRSVSQPARGTLRVELDLATPAEGTLSLYALSGRRVETFFAGEQLAAGVTRRAFDVGAIPSGVYLLRLDASGVRLARKVLVLH